MRFQCASSPSRPTKFRQPDRNQRLGDARVVERARSPPDSATAAASGANGK